MVMERMISHPITALVGVFDGPKAIVILEKLALSCTQVK
jgi:hypothetical protein